MGNYTPKLSDFSTKIKHVYIELKNYKYFHSPFSKDIRAKGTHAMDGRFIGRKSVKARIKDILKNSKSRSGAYLVAGFRGVGKTSVVRMAVQEYNEEVLEAKKEEKSKRFWGKKLLSWLQLHKKRVIVSVVILLIIAISLFNANIFLGSIGVSMLFIFIISKFSLRIFFTFSNTVLLGCLIAYCFYPDQFCAAFGWCGTTVKQLPFFIGGEDYRIWSVLFAVIVWGIINLIVFIGIDSYRFKRSSVETDLITYQSFEINLSQDEILEIDVLKRITQNLLTYWNSLNRDDYEPYNRWLYQPFRWIVSLFDTLGFREKEQRSYSSIQDSLESLSQRISAQVTSENRLGLSPNLTVSAFMGGLGRLATPLGGFSRNRKTAYPIANAKEIESELINIFKNIDTFREYTEIPNFIFIIDELDKIEPHYSIGLTEREVSDPSFDDQKNYNETANLTRKRQESVARLLANLKGFLNVVRAKFFFIGGRELYDASLADIADRDSFYSSIFNRIIYVSSFFKDKEGQRAGITQMTEIYLCKIILSNLEKEKDSTKKNDDSIYNLKLLYNSIFFEDGKLYFKEGNTESNAIAASDQSYIEKLMRYKIIFLLQDFVIYLTYRSNGTPKKLATLTEKLITHLPAGINENENLIIKHKHGESIDNDSLFLRFKFDFQYEIGLTAYIYRPYLIINSRHLKAFGDKLLFSSAFIFDHILKFHNYSFSWRNLELIPEVILVNKEPNLRQFIEELMHFLSKTQIKDTVSGINQYRFFNKIDTELKYVSKISDLSAAAFNFTLDESLQIKRHYKLRLRELENKYDQYHPVEGDNQFIHAISFIQTILGDLHFYDKEYDEALVYYMESMQSIRLPQRIDIPFTKHQFFIGLRNKLKAALTLEKMRAYDSAISYYATLCKDLPIYLKKVVFPEEVKYKNNTYRNIQMLSTPYVAFLAAIEKSRNDGITYANLKEKEIELRALIKLEEKDKRPNFYDTSIKEAKELDYYRKFLLMADFYNNVGSILFYKNCEYPMLFQKQYINLHDLPAPILDYVNKVYNDRSKEGYDFYPSISAFIYYYLSAKYLVEYHRERLLKVGHDKDYNSLNESSCLQLLPLLLLPECLDFINSGRFYYLANVLSKLGDAVLGSLNKKQLTRLPDWEFFRLIDHSKAKPKNFLNNIKGFVNQLSEGSEDEELFSLSNVFLLYELAAAFYLRSGREQSFNYQYRKILYLVKDILGCIIDEEPKDKPSIDTNKLLKRVESIACKLFQTITWATEVSNRPQILKYRDVFNIYNPDDDRSIIYNNINTSPDTREIVILVEQIRIRLSILFPKSVNMDQRIRLDNFFISCYGIINHRYVRLLELEYQADVHRYIFDSVLNIKTIFQRYPSTKVDTTKVKEKLNTVIPRTTLSEDDLSGLDCLSFFVKESIFCLRELIRSLHIYGLGSFLSYSYLAFAHQHLGDWCQAYRYLLEKHRGEESKSFGEEVKRMIGNNAIAYLEPNFHYEEAIQHYYKAIQLHTEGRAYKESVLNMYMLEDDYNDNLKHFVTGLERQRVNSGRIRKRIRDLRSIIKRSKLHKYSSYFPIFEELESRNGHETDQSDISV